MLPPLSRTIFRSPAARLLHGNSPARALDGGGPQAWAELDASVDRSTFERSKGWTSSGTVRVGPHRFDAREIADWSTAPHWHDGHGVTWAATPPAAPELALCLCHADPRVREAALGRAAGRPEVLALVLIRCADTEEPVRERARAVLTAELDAAPAGPVHALTPLALLLSTRRYGARAWELWLERLGSPPAALIVELTRDPDAGTRFAAVRAALAHGLLPADRIADRLATGPLVARTARNHPAHLRRAALRLPAAQGDDEGLPALTSALDDPDPALRRIALDLLRGWDWQATARRETFEPAQLRTLYRRHRAEMRRVRLTW